jgi:hypothetical protein
MSDLLPSGSRNVRDTYVSRETLAKRGVTAIGSIAAGLVLLVVKALPFAAGIIAGGIITIAGLFCLPSKSREDKRAGIFLSAAGVLALLSRTPLFHGIAGGLLSLGIAGLLGFGLWKGFQFIRGLKARG